ncbi:TPA: hypothetical protein QDB19_004101 [Burkholderia vietnamiensis]|nr:hypothetical protein [Burkholderia vietnamiensis]
MDNAAAPVEQPAAAPIDNSEARRLASQLRMVCDEQGCRFNACEEAADYLEALVAVPAPSPADERAAFEAWWTRDVPVEHKASAYALLKQFGDDYAANKRCAEAWEVWQARAASASATGAEGAKPTAWVRFRSDGGFEGPIMDSDERMCDVRRKSGAWTPLYRSPAMAVEAVAIPNSPAYCLRGLYKPADEYFIDGKPCTPDEYIAWQAGIIEAVTKAKLPDPKYYGGSAEEGDQHDVKCAYVDGWNDCRASILAAPQPPAQADARVGLTEALADCLKIIDENRKRIGYEPGSPNDKTVRAARALLQGANQ